jgi:hypothetical protein
MPCVDPPVLLLTVKPSNSNSCSLLIKDIASFIYTCQSPLFCVESPNLQRLVFTLAQAQSLWLPQASLTPALQTQMLLVSAGRSLNS